LDPEPPALLSKRFDPPALLFRQLTGYSMRMCMCVCVGASRKKEKKVISGVDARE